MPNSGQIPWQPTANREMLQFRAEVLAASRYFFAERGVLEVSTPALSSYATTEPAITSFSVSSTQSREPYYLHSSPEFTMKRLLAASSGSIYQISPVFRDSDHGRFHRSEFTLLEWYRPEWDYRRLMEEVEQLIRSLPLRAALAAGSQSLSYRELFQRYLSLDPFTAEVADCRASCQQHDLPVPESMGEELDPWLDLLLSMLIAPRLPDNTLTFIYDFPPSQAALSRLQKKHGQWVAERFELYWGRVELANGFQELTDAAEQEARFSKENQLRKQRGQPPMPVDGRFLAALAAGMPECSGVALGIDRLLMCLSGSSEISQVMTFADDAMPSYLGREE